MGKYQLLNYTEEKVFQRTIESLSEQLCSIPVILEKQDKAFKIDLLSRTMVKNKRNFIHYFPSVGNDS